MAGRWVLSTRARGEEKEPTSLFIEPATNIEQLVSIRPVIAAFTQPLSYPLAKWRGGRARTSNNHFFPGTVARAQRHDCAVRFRDSRAERARARVIRN